MSVNIKCMDYDGMGNCSRFPSIKKKSRITFWGILGNLLFKKK